MNPRDALRLMVKGFPGGLEVIALRIGKTPEVLRKELAGDPKFKLGLDTALSISELCREAQSPDCDAFLHAVTVDSGVMVRLPVVDMNDLCPHGATAALVRGAAAVVSQAVSSLNDGVVSDNELHDIRLQILKVIGKLHRLEKTLRARNRAGKPEGDV